MPAPHLATRSLKRRVLSVAGVVAVLGLGWWLVRTPRAEAPAPAAGTPPEPKLGAQATLSSAVVQAMVTGNAALLRGGAGDLVQARAAFEQSVALDERYAPAHAALAHALVRLADAGVERPSAVLPKAIEHGDLAVELDPAGARGWHALARAEVLWTRDWSRAETHYRRAMALDPGAAEAVAGLIELLAAVGRSQEAVDESLKALAVHPRSSTLLTSAGVAQYLAGHYQEALDRFGLARAEGGKEWDVAPWDARARAALGMTNEALEAARQAAASAGAASAWVVGFVHAQAGRRQEAEEVLAAMGRQVAQGYVPALGFAYVRAALGQRDEALAFVETGVREHSPGSELLLVDPIFAALGSEPRFRAALDELKLGGRR
jgi:tetratricopeptide (TPR) repeat protein